jgi:hypothetical protein
MDITTARATQKAIWRYLDRVGGYQPYGWDWPTLRMLYPRMAVVLRACMEAQKEVA